MTNQGMREGLVTCKGFVFDSDPHPREPEKTLWRIRIESPEEFRGKKATVDLNNIPPSLIKGMKVEFEVAPIGRHGALIAFHTRPDLRHNSTTEQPNNSTEGTKP